MTKEFSAKHGHNKTGPVLAFGKIKMTTVCVCVVCVCAKVWTASIFVVKREFQ